MPDKTMKLKAKKVISVRIVVFDPNMERPRFAIMSSSKSERTQASNSDVFGAFGGVNGRCGRSEIRLTPLWSLFLSLRAP